MQGIVRRLTGDRLGHRMGGNAGSLNMELLVILFILGCVYAVLTILKNWFAPRRISNRYAIPNDQSIRMDRRHSRRHQRSAEVVLLIMIVMAMIGAILYLRGL